MHNLLRMLQMSPIAQERCTYLHILCEYATSTPQCVVRNVLCVRMLKVVRL